MQKELHRCKSSGYGKMDRFGPWIWIELWNTWNPQPNHSTSLTRVALWILTTLLQKSRNNTTTQLQTALLLELLHLWSSRWIVVELKLTLIDFILIGAVCC